MSRKALPILAILLASMLLLALPPVGGQTAAALSTAGGSQALAPAAGTSEATEPSEEAAFQRTKEPVAWRVDPYLIDNLTSPDYPFPEVRFIIVCENEEAKAYVSEHLPSNVKLITYFRYLPFITASVPKGTDPAVIYRIAEMPGVKGVVADRMVRLQSLTAGDRFLVRLDEATGKPTIQQLPWPPKPSYFADYPWFLNETAELIGATRMWEMGYTGEGVVVAVIDTGVTYKDYGSGRKAFKAVPDLAQTEIVEGYDFVNNRKLALDDHGHGTHVAGTIAQSTHNGIGVAGVAFKAKIMPLKVLSARGFGNVADIAEAVRFAAKTGEKGWTCEWRVPWTALGVSPGAPPEKWLMNIGVRSVPAGVWLAWAPTGGRICDVDKAGELHVGK